VESRHPESGFTSIPISMYWAVVTLTTVGYGDVAPVTPLGQMLAAMIMVVGYGIIAVPTGIVSVELAQAARKMDEEDRERAQAEGGADAGAPARPRRLCPDCGLDDHHPDAHFCRRCGVLLPTGVTPP